MVDPNNHPESIDSKFSIVDIKCVDEQGTAYIIEMQVINQAGYLERCQYYTCFEIARQLDKSDPYKKLTPVIFVGVANFALFDNPRYISHHRVLDTATHENELTLMEFHFLELTKFKKNLDAIDSVIDQWAYFLKHAGEVDEIPSELKENKEIVRAFEILEQAKFTKQELGIYNALVDQYRTEVGRIDIALETKSIEIAKKLLAHGIDLETIKESTDLSIDLLKKLKKQ
jgi:predicted transposase/invertase (TIGR01784 family)